jgi:acyl-CoA thioester hydrolase
MSSVSEIRFRVRYAETDQMGVVYHANYFIWMEMGRVELCRSIGIRYRDLEEKDGILLTVAEVNCRYLSPARYDDDVSVVTTVKRASSRLLEFEYGISSAESGIRFATGSTVHIFCNRELRPCRLPDKHWAAFGVDKMITS